VARQKGNQDAGVTIAGDQRGIRSAVHGGDLDGSGDPRRRTAEHARQDDHVRHSHPGQPRGAWIAADDGRGESEDGALHQDVGNDAGRNPNDQPVVDVQAGDGADHIDLTDVPRGWLVQTLRIAQRSLDEVIHQRDAHVCEQEAADGLVDPALHPQVATEPDPGAAHDTACDEHPGDGGPYAGADTE
jgi:hypothetical protein